MKEEIITYYNELAKKYDFSRFANSYGEFIDIQENRILQKHLSTDICKNLDIACGTGRFLSYAHYGVDISSEMIEISKNKFPTKDITLGDAENLSFPNNFFSNVLSFHLFMHLDKNTINTILNEIHRVIETKGKFIFDVPSLKRRKITGYKSTSWHGGYQINVSQLKELMNDKWELKTYYGIAFFPIHRIPKKLRKLFLKIDNILCRSFLKEYSSHLVFVLQKK